MSQQINLFNPVFLKKNKLFSAVTMLQGLSIIVAGLAGICFLSANRVINAREEAKVAAASLKAAQTQLTQMVERTKPTQKDKSLEEAIKREEERLQASQHVLEFVNKGELGNTQGYAEFFRVFSRRSIPGVWLTGISFIDGGSGIEISGRAQQPTMVPSYLSMLRQEVLFKGRSFGSLELRAPQSQAGSKVVTAKSTPEIPYVEFTLKSSDAIEDHNAQGSVQTEARTQ